jgi:hypothetical protein
MLKRINNNMSGKPQPNKPRKTTPGKAVSKEQLENLLKEALTSFAQDKKRTTTNEIEAMLATLEEFLQTFVLIGYTLDGEPFSVINAHSQQEADSLSTAVTRFFMTRCQGGME